MSQQYTRLMRSIWTDPEFLVLPIDVKMVFLMLMSQPDINACGVLGLRPKRWATFFPDRTQAQITRALNPLVRDRFIVIDEDTEEVFVRSFMRHDGAFRQTNGPTAIANARGGVLSLRLRRMIDDIIGSLPSGKPPRGQSTVDGTVNGTVDGTDAATVRTRVPNPLPDPLPSSSSGPVRPTTDDVFEAALTLAAVRSEIRTNRDGYIGRLRADWSRRRQTLLAEVTAQHLDVDEAAGAFCDAIGIKGATQHVAKPVDLRKAAEYGASVAASEIADGIIYDPEGFAALCNGAPEWNNAAKLAYRAEHEHAPTATVHELRSAR